MCEFERASSLIIYCYGQAVTESYFDSLNGITSESRNSLRPFATRRELCCRNQTLLWNFYTMELRLVRKNGISQRAVNLKINNQGVNLIFPMLFLTYVY